MNDSPLPVIIPVVGIVFALLTARDTEQRIALARSTFYNTRLQVLPDRFVARLGRLQPQPLMAAADFERAPVQVAFAG